MFLHCPIPKPDFESVQAKKLKSTVREFSQSHVLVARSLLMKYEQLRLERPEAVRSAHWLLPGHAASDRTGLH